MGKIILYSTGCVKCKELKMLLDKKSISYELCDSVDEMLKLGFDKVPVLYINGDYMDFEAAKKWINTTEENEHEKQ